MLYAFPSDGTLVITAHGSTPTVGTWKYENGALTMIEQGQSYPTDIVVLSADQFTIRSHNPGTPVEITLERAARLGTSVARLAPGLQHSPDLFFALRSSVLALPPRPP